MILWSANGGTNQSRLGSPHNGLATTHYTGVSGFNGEDSSTRTVGGVTISAPQFAGIFTNRSKTSLTAIPDGTSNTLLMGEGLGGNPAANDFGWSWYGIGEMPTMEGLASAGQASSGIVKNPWRMFGSAHAAGVNFAFADGSVHVVRFGGTTTVGSSDWMVLQQLAGKGDGQVFDASSLTN